MPVKVKICGITNIADALAAVELGADMLGFNFYPPSPRYLTAEKAIEIIKKLPTFVDTVGIFVNPGVDELRDMVGQGFLNWIQLHGDESPEFCDDLRWVHAKTIKAVRVRSHDDIERAQEYGTDGILLDAFHPELYGGTGETFDWEVVGHINRRVFLAGGITADNAVKAVEVGVYAIDVCSGIEVEPGRKDHEKMKKLFKNIEHVRG